MELHLEEYNYEEFVKVSQRLLMDRYRLNTEIAERIAYLVWDRIKSKDIRDVLKIARLTTSLSDVDWLVDVQVKYGKFKE
jgi:Holliday junction DNA helicase RuvB